MSESSRRSFFGMLAGAVAAPAAVVQIVTATPEAAIPQVTLRANLGRPMSVDDLDGNFKLLQEVIDKMAAAPGRRPPWYD